MKIAIKCFLHQTYPQDRMEWIIIDDGTDKIQDLIDEANIPQIKYFAYDDKMTIGKKRNLLNSKCAGDIIIYADDDDYYPTDRIEHTVNMMEENPEYLCAGSDIMFTYFTKWGIIAKFGPYYENHATAGTLAFRKELLNETEFDDTREYGEEMLFLKKFTIPMLQLDPDKTILVINHNANTVDKSNQISNTVHTRLTRRKLSEFVSDETIKEFYESFKGK
jgi:glycosyltransferase involved in cell wall biosynthesis